MAMQFRNECRVQQLMMPDASPLETLWASVSWKGCQAVTVSVIYRPLTSPLGDSLDHLSHQLQAACCFGKPLFLLGDANINVLDDSTLQMRNYTTVFDEHGMEQLVQDSTHLHPVPTALVHLKADKREPVPTVEVSTDTISDHQSVITRARLGRVRQPAEWRTVRSWWSVEWNAVCHDLPLPDRLESGTHRS